MFRRLCPTKMGALLRTHKNKNHSFELLTPNSIEADKPDQVVFLSSLVSVTRTDIFCTACGAKRMSAAQYVTICHPSSWFLCYHPGNQWLVQHQTIAGSEENNSNLADTSRRAGAA